MQVPPIQVKEKSGAFQPTIAKVFALTEAAEAVRYLIEDRPFGQVVMSTII
jgi:NADPH:quinone reductase